jgi:beta-lactamase regulating signal transducer with metallopeptidase domain
MSWLRNALERIDRTTRTSPDEKVSWPAIVASTFITGTALGLGRLMLGLRAVNRCRKLSRQIDDPGVNQLLEWLRTGLGCSQNVTVRQSAELCGPATIGWLQPVILLPADWREWDASELQAVLAHELVHIHRRDFVARVIAGFSSALHIYHPLLHWLSGRLCLQQELAADASAAPLAGGRERYLRALARLALRLDASVPAWPARPFLSSPRTLMRRIQMLRTKEGLTDRYVPIRTTTAILVISAIAISAFRSAAGDADLPHAPPKGGGGTAVEPPLPPILEGARIRAANTAAKQSDNKPFDLRYVPEDAKGILMFRPAITFARPGMRTFADLFTLEFHEFESRFLHGAKLELRIEDIDLVVATVTVTPPTDGAGGKATIQSGLRALRTVKDFDWLKQMKALIPSLQEVQIHDAGQVYYRIPKGFFPYFGLEEMSFVIPDSRTILFSTKVPGTAPRPLPEWLANWKAVEREDLALAIDTRDCGWMREHAKTSKDLSPVVANGVADAKSLTFGFSANDDIRLTALARCASKSVAENLMTMASQYLEKKGNDALATIRKNESGEHDRNIAERILLHLSANSKWSCNSNGPDVQWSSHLNVGPGELCAAFLPVLH